MSERVHAYKFLTSLGVMAIAWEGSRVLAIKLPEKTEERLLSTLRRRLKSPRLTWTLIAPVFVREMAQKLRAHLQGDPQKFSTRNLALEKQSPFFREVYSAAARIPSGKLRTYQELAKAAGRPLASRAVGQAMAKNPFPIVVPCHRVIGSGKSFGGFTAFGGLGTKARLLELEIQ